ncbi:MAG TPA: tetratricopeptide repeat protein [Actinomycetota bacterium]|nr:tetratricopeptide repeat protein [Actinomycetota bacterium]
MTCPVCGQPIPEGARFCPSCGALVGAPLGTEERKMVTVLFADLVDSTGLAQRLDAERAREVLSRFSDVATEELLALRGRPEKFIGDAVMAVFGLPQVHEDDALRAVRAGLAIRERIHRIGTELGLPEPLEVRIGIESGEAATGLGPAGQLLVTGSVVNAAARLEAAAGPGEVLAGVTTVALTADAVTYGPQREVAAKGFTTALPAFPVQSLSARSARRTIPFVGRASELAILRESLSRVSASGHPVLVTVLGEPGIGKTRLADELVAGLGDDVVVLQGRTRSYTDTRTFAPAAAIVADLAGADEGDPPDKALRRLRELVERAGEEPDRVERTVERLSLLFEMAERRGRTTYAQDVQAGVIALLDALARETPVVVVFEDAHTLQPAMLDLVERLGGRAREGERRAMILALARPQLLDERPAWGGRAANAIQLRLDPLSDQEAIDLARQASGGRIGEAEAAEIAARAGGNPFFIIETTGMLLPDSPERPGPRHAIPPTVQAVVAARLDHLDLRLREIARHASIFFVSFDREELAVVDPAATEEDLRRLEEAEVLVREEDVQVPRWRIRHSTLRDVAYASLPKRERVRLQQAVADQLAARGHRIWAAGHLEEAALASLDLDPDDRTVAERAADALVEAGDRTRRRMESRSAVDFYRRALALVGPEEDWGVREARALAGLGEARYWLGEYAAATEDLERAIELASRLGDRFALALALRFLGDIALNIEADTGRAEELFAGSLAAAEELHEPWAIVRTLLFAGWVPWTRGDYEEAEKMWRRVLDEADPDDGWARARALNSISIARSSADDHDAALALSEEATELAERIGDQFSIAVTAVQRGRVLEDLKRYAEAHECLERGVAIFEDLGARWELADATAERGEIRRELGRLDEAEEDIRRAIRISEELGERQLGAWLWRAMARVSERRGDQAEAEHRLQRSREAEERRPR